MAHITETVYLESKPSIDPDVGVIPGVKVLGFESKNGRTYERQAVVKALPRYEGSKVFINHPTRSELGQDRDFRDWAGVIENVTIASDGAYADLRLRKEASSFSELCEAATDFWADFGMSHVADGTSRMDGDREVIESINEILSVDIVCSPATTNGLYESTNKEPEMAKKRVRKTIRKIVEDAPKTTKNRGLLVEAMHDEAGNPIAELPIDVPEDAAPESNPEDEIMAGLLAAIAAKVKEADPDTLKKVMALLELGTDVVDVAAGGGDTGGGDGGDGGDAGGDTQESKYRALETKFALMESKTMLLESGREASPARVKALAGSDQKDRKALLESWPKIAAKRSNGRPVSSPPAEGNNESAQLYESEFDAAAKRAKESLDSYRRV